MTVVLNNSFWNADGKRVGERQVKYEGATIRAWQDTVQVMSDIWELMLHVEVWDEAEQRAIVLMEPAAYVVDATPEVLAKYLTWYGERKFEYYQGLFARQAVAEALRPQKGDKVRVVRGKVKAPDPKAFYPIVVSIEAPYNTGWKSVIKRKFAIALSDKKEPRTAKNGKVYDSYVDLLWVWEQNVELETADARRAEAEAKAAERAKDISLGETAALIEKIQKSPLREMKEQIVVGAAAA
jgi:hypothetical protein